MSFKINIQVAVVLGIVMLFAFSPSVSARGRFGLSLGGPIGVHASTNGGVGVSLPTPQVSVGTSGAAYDVTTTADLGGVRADVSGPNGVSGDVTVDVPLEPAYYNDEF